MTGFRYIYRDQVWEVDERDRVYVAENGKEVALGYNHTRPYKAMCAAVKQKTEK